MKTKIISSILFLVIFASVFSVSLLNVSAETEGIFDYYNEGDYGYTMLEKCNKPVGKVVIPSTLGGSPVVTIHDRAFENATELTAVVIPESITGIYATSFIGCTNLKDVYYEGSVTEWNKMHIGFESEIDEGVREIPLLDATIHFNGDKDITAQKSGIFEYIIENEIAIIMKCDRTAKGKIEVPEKLGGSPVAVIGNHAFFNCTEIEEIKLPKTITDISSSAFAYCEKLRYINIPDTVMNIKPFAFVECTSLESITLSDSLTEIAMGTFKHSGLKSISVPPSVRTISYRAFAWCENLENVRLSKGLETIEEGAFSYTAIKELTFPEGFQKIDMWSITYCEKLEAISIPKSVNEIGINICDGCTNLKTVKYAGSEVDWQKVNIMRPNVEIEETDIEFSDKTPTVGKAENGYYYIIENETAIVIGGDEETIDGSVDIPATLGGYEVKKIAPNAFSAMEIYSINIPTGVTEIGTNAFAYCNQVSSVFIPLSVKTIGYNAFYACKELTDVYYESDQNNWNKIKFADGETKSQFAEMTITYGSEEVEYVDATELFFGLIFAFSISIVTIIVIILVKKKKANKENISE